MTISTLRRSAALVLAFTTMTLGLPLIANAAIPANVTLTVHYQRVESDYTSWNLWLWKNVQTGTDVDVSKSGVAFTGEDTYGKIATVELTGMDKFDNVGIIVRKGEWLAKDVPDDRFITQFGADGKAEVWLRQGDPVIYYQVPTTPAPVAAGSKLAKVYDAPDFAAKYTYTCLLYTSDAADD